MNYKETVVWRGLRFLYNAAITFKVNLMRWLLVRAIHVYPQHAHLFSYMKRLPSSDQRIPKTDNPLDDFDIIEDPLSSEIKYGDKVNVVMRGCSFDNKKLKELNETTFLVNWPEKVEHPNVVYATADQGDLWAMIQKGMTPLFFVNSMYYEDGNKKYGVFLKPETKKYIQEGIVNRVFLNHKSNCPDIPISSGLAVVMALTKYCKEMHIYGFDQYQEKDLSEMSYWEALASLSKVIGGGPVHSAKGYKLPAINDITERAIYSWHYAGRFHQIPWIKNDGYLASLYKHKALTNRLEKIFYNN